MENNCVTLETALKLQVAGFVQDTYFWYIALDDGAWVRWGKDNLPDDANGSVRLAAATAQELMDQLPLFTKVVKTDVMPDHELVYYAQCNELNQRTVQADTICEALAALWLALQEANHE